MIGNNGLTAVRAAILQAAQAAGRNPNDINLIAVSKTHPADAVRSALLAGQRNFGENRVQEAAAKFPALRLDYPDLRLHLIGPLQTNKAAEAVGLFDAIHSLDRPKLAAILATEMTKQNRKVDCFVQVNTGLEAQKAGIDPQDAEAFVIACRQTWALPVVGLMCIPPAGANPVPHFIALRELAIRSSLPYLSMGMSGDYPAAIAAGATHVRIGSAIFGVRPAA